MEINTKSRVYYALPVTAMALLYGGPLVVLQGIYAKYFGLSLTSIASVLLFARLFDTITDPIIGYYSDRYHARKGSRKPFIFSGSIIFIIGAYFLFTPPVDVTVYYMAISFLAFYLGFTLFNVPHYAWGKELSKSSEASVQVFTIRSLMMAVGGMLFYLIPQLPLVSSDTFTPETLRLAVISAGLLLLPALYMCLTYVPDSHGFGTEYLNKKATDQNLHMTPKSNRIRILGKQIISNKPFLIFLGALLLWGLGIGSWGGLLFIFIDSYLDMGDNFSLVALIGTGCSILSIYLWAKIALRYGKIAAWISSTLTTAASILLMAFLTPENNNLVLLTIVMILAFFGAISVTIFAPALLSDIVDYSTLKFGKELAASYFSLYFLAWKATEASGVAIGLMVAGFYGLDLSAKNHSSDAIFGLRVAAIWLPLFLFSLSMMCIYWMPINSRRHKIVCKALGRRRRENLCLL